MPCYPYGSVRGTSVEALLPTVLEGFAITELPEFVATQYFPTSSSNRYSPTGACPREVSTSSRRRPAPVLPRWARWQTSSLAS
jgi:hypothetical protein